MAVLYGTFLGLVVAASLGLPYVVGYALVVGPLLGWLIGRDW